MERFSSDYNKKFTEHNSDIKISLTSSTPCTSPHDNHLNNNSNNNNSSINATTSEIRSQQLNNSVSSPPPPPPPLPNNNTHNSLPPPLILVANGISSNRDTVKTYYTEDTPASQLSHAGSNSDLSVLSIITETENSVIRLKNNHNNTCDIMLENDYLSDISSSMSSDDNDSILLAECIQSGMPMKDGSRFNEVVAATTNTATTSNSTTTTAGAAASFDHNANKYVFLFFFTIFCFLF